MFVFMYIFGRLHLQEIGSSLNFDRNVIDEAGYWCYKGILWSGLVGKLILTEFTKTEKKHGAMCSMSYTQT